MKQFVFACLSLFFVVFIAPGGAHALATEWLAREFVSVRAIVASGTSAKDKAAKPLKAGVEFKLEKGWKMYWRSPGDAGIPLSLNSGDSVNVEQVELQWPAPTRYVEGWGLEVWGYKEKVVLPLVVKRKDATQPAQLKLKLNYSACSDICVPFEDTLELMIPVESKPDAQLAARIDAFEKRVPKASGAHAMRIERAEIAEEKKDKGVLEVLLLGSGVTNAAEVFVEGPQGARFMKPEKNTRKGRGLIVRVPYELAITKKTLAGEDVRVTVVGADYKSVENLFKAAASKTAK